MLLILWLPPLHILLLLLLPPVMVRPPFPFSTHPWPPLTPSTSTLLHLPPLHSNSKDYLCNLCNYAAPTLRLTTDQSKTCLNLVPTPRATIYIHPFYIDLIGLILFPDKYG